MSQQIFAQAILNPDLPEPDGLTGPQGGAAGGRFDVYRNNVVVSLIEAVEAGFPALRSLIGPNNFKSLAGVFVRQHPPQSRIMPHYGDDLPDFLAGFAPLAKHPYLPDIARLELAQRRAYHAADAPPLDPARLAALDDASFTQTRAIFAPAVQVLSSDWPIYGIWQKSQNANAPAPQPGGQGVLITRPEYDPIVTQISLEQAQTITALQHGAPLADALQQTDATALFTLLLTTHALTNLKGPL